VFQSTIDAQGTVSNSIGDVVIGDNLNITGNTDNDGTMNVDGNTTLTTVTASGAAVFQSTIDAQGAVSNSTGDLNLADNVIITGTTDAQGAVSNSVGDLNLNDNVIITGTTDAQGVISNSVGQVVIGDDLNITGNTDNDGTMNVDGNTTLTTVTASCSSIPELDRCSDHDHEYTWRCHSRRQLACRGKYRHRR
jgi:hypothetical protein